MNDFLPLNRKITKHWLWEDKPFSKGQAWIDLLMLANYAEKKKPLNGEIIIYKRGTINLSQSQLADRWGWDRRTVKRFLDLLSNDNMVSVDSTTHGTTITLINYEVFNNSCTTNSTTDSTTNAHQNVQPMSQQDVQPIVQQTPATNKDNNDKKLEKDKESKKEKKDTYLAERKQIIEYLNQVCGTSYGYSADYVKKNINARINEKHTVEEFYMVIDKKYEEWHGTDMEKFLRPQTLFGTKFENYLNQPFARKRGNNNNFGQGKIDWDNV